MKVAPVTTAPLGRYAGKVNWRYLVEENDVAQFDAFVYVALSAASNCHVVVAILRA